MLKLIIHCIIQYGVLLSRELSTPIGNVKNGSVDSKDGMIALELSYTKTDIIQNEDDGDDDYV